MATITSTQTGAWITGSTWSGGIVPSIGDNAVIANGHTVTISVGNTVTVGTSATIASASIKNVTTGQLVVSGTLRVLSNMVQLGATWSVGPGAVVESMNTASVIVWNSNGGMLSYAGNGVGAGRAIIRKGAGSAGFSVQVDSAGTPNWNKITGSFGLFQGLGSSGVYGVSAEENLTGGTGGWGISDTVFDGCGQIGTANYSLNVNTPLVWQRVRIKNSVNYYAANIAGVYNPVAQRLMEDCAFDNTVRYLPPSGSFRRCVFGTGTDFLQTPWAEFSDCIVNFYTDSAAKGDILRGFRTMNNTFGSNWHGYSWQTPTGSITIDGTIFDAVVGDSVGDLVISNLPSAPQTINVKNILCTKGYQSGGSYGKLISALGNASSSFTIEHCTAYTVIGESGLIGVGETYAGYSGMISSSRSNLIVGIASGSGVMFLRQQIGINANIKNYVTQSAMTNNFIQNPIPGSGSWNGLGNRSMADGGQPLFDFNPTNPLTGSVSFYDDTRNLATWYRSVVGSTPGTRPADMVLAFDAFGSQWDDSPVAGATILNAYNWIRAGYYPQNIALRAAHDLVQGGWIGAVGDSPGNSNVSILGTVSQSAVAGRATFNDLTITWI